jgi:hypothetical protein
MRDKRRPISSGASILALTALLYSCSESPSAPPPPPQPLPPTTAAVHTGDSQTATVASPVPIAPAVVVRNVKGGAVADVQVVCIIAGGGGSVSGAATRTGADGIAQVEAWVLGSAAGENTLSCTVGALPPVLFAAIATAAAPVNATVHAGQDQDATVMSAVAVAPALVLRDQYDNPVAGVSIACVPSGDSRLDPSGVPSDRGGVAVAGVWTLGSRAGSYTLECGVAGVEPVVITATGHAGAAAQLVPHAGLDQTATVAASVPISPAIRVADAYDNPVAGVPVVCTVAEGGGTVTGATANTDTAGIATLGVWTLGTVAGPNRLNCTVAGVEPVVITATGHAGAPAEIAPHAGLDQTAAVATAVTTSPAIRVADAYDNPVAGAPVACSVTEGGGTVSGAAASTDSAGVATIGAWTLGTAAGPNRLACASADLDPVVFAALGVAGPVSSLRLHAGAGQTAEPGEALPVTPAVRAADTYDNPVSGAPVEFTLTGGGSITRASMLTDAHGMADAGTWELGPYAGPSALTATVAGLEPVTVSALAEPAGGFDLRIESVHINQGSQTTGGTIGLVAGRPGLLRVVVSSNVPNLYTPDVRVRLFKDGSLLREAVVAAPRNGVPVEPSLDLGDETWNLMLAADDIVPGLEIEAVVDPAGAIVTRAPDAQRYPRGAGTALLNSQPVPPLRIVFFPMHSTVNNNTGSITEENASAFLEATRLWIPSSTIEVTVRPPFTTQHDFTTRDGWLDALVELQAIRTLEGARDQYYHGIVGDVWGIAYGGLAYMPSRSSSTFRSGLTYDRPGSASEILAHELGHNLGRPHAPCGALTYLDPHYPHPNAALGSPGVNNQTGTVVPAHQNYRDYMSYCGPRWTSDFTYESLLQWRRSDALANWEAPTSFHSAAATATAPITGILLWGGTGALGPVLHPVFALESQAVLPTHGGANTARGLDRDGREIFRLTFDGVSVADVEGPDEEHFTWFVPLDESQIASLSAIELITPRGTASRETRTPSPAGGVAGARPSTDVRVDALTGGRTRVRWNDEQYPLALVRDAVTGQILSFARNGDALIRTAGVPESRIEVIVSDGVRSEAWRR